MKHLLTLLCTVSAGWVSAQNWHEIPVGTIKQLNTVDFPSPDVGYIGGNDSLLLKTTDGGQTWQPVNYTGIFFFPSGEHLLKLNFITETTGFVTVGPYSGSYKTTDGGLTWSPLTLSSNMCYNNGSYFFDEQNGFIGGSGCFQGELMDRMTNGNVAAVSIESSGFNPAYMITDIDFRGTQNGLAVSSGGLVYRTTDSGASWDSVPTPYGNTVSLTSVRYFNDTICYAGYVYENSGGFGLLISEDGGLTWADDPNSQTFFYPSFYGIHLAGNNEIYIGGKPSWNTNGLIFHYSNQLQWWQTDQVEQPIRALSSYNDSIIFAVGDSGYVVTNTLFSSLGAKELSVSPEMLVFPNPVSGKVTIAFPGIGLNDNQYRLFTVSGVLAREGKLDSGQLDIEELKSGTYLLEVDMGAMIRTSRIVRE